MSACCITTTARSWRWRAWANAARMTAMLSPIRACSSATCSRVGVVWPRPVHGCRSLLLPTTWTTAKSTSFRRSRVGGEDLTVQGEAAQRRVAAVVRAVAVGPLVVPGGVDEGVLEAVEVGPDHPVVRLAAAGGAVLDVADVEGQVGPGGVDLLDPAGERRDLVRAVGDVPDHGERVFPVPARCRGPREGGGGTGEGAGQGQRGQGDQAAGGHGTPRRRRVPHTLPPPLSTQVNARRR